MSHSATKKNITVSEHGEKVPVVFKKILIPCILITSFCESLMFPTIYGFTLKGIGEDAKDASAFLVMAIVGGATLPFLQGLLLDIAGSGYDNVRILGAPIVNFSFVLPLLCYVVAAIYGYRAIHYKQEF